MLDADVAEGTAALTYLQLVANSEFGTLFLSKDGKITFRGRNSVPNTPDIVFSDEVVAGIYTGIQFADVNIDYGSENLYNRITLENSDIFPEQAFAEDATSQAVYGPRTLSQTGLLIQEPTQLQFLADFFLARYKEPQYRFETVTVVLDTLTTVNQDKVLDLEIGDIVLVRFEPSDIPPAIEQYCRIIGINHDWTRCGSGGCSGANPSRYVPIRPWKRSEFQGGWVRPGMPRDPICLPAGVGPLWEGDLKGRRRGE